MGHRRRRAACAAALLLLLAPLTAGRSPETPLPPVALAATPTSDGTVLSWLPPLYDGGHPVVSYAVARLVANDPLHTGWEPVGAVPASTTTFLDPEPPVGFAVFYAVAAINEAGPSLPSEPVSAKSSCPIIGLAGTPPEPGVNPWCIFHQEVPGEVEVKVLWLEGES